MALGLSFWSPISWRRFIRCICSKIAFLCGVVSSTTCLTGWQDRSWSSVSLIICIVFFGFVCKLCCCWGWSLFGALPLFCWQNLCYFGFGLSLSFELTALILIVTLFFTMVARWSGLVRNLLWGLLRHSVYGHFIRSFQGFSHHVCLGTIELS